ncbi:MAG: hypothetical protein AVDCRST_MAG29-336, partial [uncultured Nocardioidaceae bacterium]
VPQHPSLAQLRAPGERGRGPQRRAAVRPQDQWLGDPVSAQRRGVPASRGRGDRRVAGAARGAGDHRTSQGPGGGGGKGPRASRPPLRLL